MIWNHSSLLGKYNGSAMCWIHDGDDWLSSTYLRFDTPPLQLSVVETGKLEEILDWEVNCHEAQLLVQDKAMAPRRGTRG
jgi:hypothetical protein